ncbi:hypothetical protein FACS189414_5220 [Bacteroidia bacterium]|nr:hypothetical protein FACS189414_5220 [Bacteroidia bacterium]
MAFLSTTTETSFIDKFRKRYKYKIPSVNFDEALNVGDYVTINKDGTFNKEGKIDREEGMNIHFTKSPPKTDPWDIRVDGSKGFTLFAQGQSPIEGIADASVKIEFDSNNTFYYKAQALVIERMDDPILTLEKAIITRYCNGGKNGIPKWNKEYAVITAVVTGKNVVLIESSSGDVTLSCSSNLTTGEHPFNDIGVHLDIITSTSSNFKLISKEETEVAVAYVMHHLTGFPKKNKVKALKGGSSENIFGKPDIDYKLEEV